MTAVPLTLYPTRPAEEAVPEVTAPVMVELDQVSCARTRFPMCRTSTVPPWHSGGTGCNR
jgi:hypothetical protein